MKTKMVTLFAVLMIGLMVAGFAYAHWEKIITINGTVNTGTLHVSPSVHAETDDGKGYCTVETSVNETENTVYIGVLNAYPCITVSGWIDLENDGTIPVHLVDYSWEGNDTLSIVYVGTVDGKEHYDVYDGNYLVANLYLSYDFPDATQTDPFQIDPGSTAYIYFVLHFKEDLPQGVYYWFNVYLTFWNWNEVPGA